MRINATINYVLIILFSALFTACHSEKDLQNPTETSNEDSFDQGSEDAQFTSGKVSTAYVNDGCAYLIYLDNPTEDGSQFLIPIGLSDAYLSHDLRIKFEWIPSRAPSGNCYKGKPAILSNIRIL